MSCRAGILIQLTKAYLLLLCLDTTGAGSPVTEDLAHIMTRLNGLGHAIGDMPFRSAKHQSPVLQITHSHVAAALRLNRANLYDASMVII